MIKSKNSKDLRIKSVTNIFDKELSKEAKNIITKRKNPEKKVDQKRLSFKRDKNLELDFRDYMSLNEFFKSIYYRNISIENAEMKQDGFNVVLNALKTYSRKNPEYIKDKINWKMEGM